MQVFLRQCTRSYSNVWGPVHIRFRLCTHSQDIVWRRDAVRIYEVILPSAISRVSPVSLSRESSVPLPQELTCFRRPGSVLASVIFGDLQNASDAIIRRRPRFSSCHERCSKSFECFWTLRRVGCLEKCLPVEGVRTAAMRSEVTSLLRTNVSIVENSFKLSFLR